MGITKTQGYLDSGGVMHATVEAAQAAELLKLLKGLDGSDDINETHLITLAAEMVRNQAEAILAILTIGPRSKPRARKSPGTSNPKRAVKRATPEQVGEGLKAMREAAAEARKDGYSLP